MRHNNVKDDPGLELLRLLSESNEKMHKQLMQYQQKEIEDARAERIAGLEELHVLRAKQMRGEL